MNNTKTHTPGPFRAISCKDRGFLSNDWIIWSDDKGKVGHVSAVFPHAEGNARLFSAAPEMLEALSALMQPELQIEATPGGYCIFRFTPAQVASARAAINKAEGA